MKQIILIFVSALVIYAVVFISNWLSRPETKISTKGKIFRKYDYIIIGAGSAGSVIASRLSEDRDTKVLLIEAGGEESFYTDYPLFIPYLQTEPTSWQFKTVEQKHSCFGLKNRTSSWPRGRLIGGCSAINYMLYVRGNRHDYDSWEKNGATGWSYQDVLPYFLKSEGNTSPQLRKSDTHGTDGPLSVEDGAHVSPITEAILETAKKCGYKIKDYNDGDQEGFRLSQFTQKNGLRMSAARAFLRPNKNRKNLHIITNAFAEKILIDVTKRAYGVGISWKSKCHVIRAKREVILSAGAVSSPQILMLSGIGPAKELKQHNIKVVVDLQGVGKNLQDHVGVAINTPLTEGSALVSSTALSIGSIYNFLGKERV